MFCLESIDYLILLFLNHKCTQLFMSKLIHFPNLHVTRLSRNNEENAPNNTFNYGCFLQAPKQSLRQLQPSVDNNNLAYF